jgi:mannose-1-phosphate guanylyltransferase
VFNGDVLSGVDLGALLACHESSAADVTLYLTRVPDPRAFGCVPTSADGRVDAFLEKDPNPQTDQINAGTYVFTRAALEAIPSGRVVSVERETFPGLLAAGARMFGYLDTSYWRDLGTPADFVAGSADLVLGRAPSGALPGPTGPALVLPGATIAADAVLTQGTTVGSGCVIGAGAIIEGSVVFDGAVIGAGARIRSSVIGQGARVGAGAVLVDAVIGDRADIGARVELLGGARVWPDVALPDGSVRFSSDG